MKATVLALLALASLTSGCVMLQHRANAPLCVVEIHDTETGRLADRMEFVHAGLLDRQMVYGEDHQVRVRHGYDRGGRLIHTRVITEFAAQLPDDAFSWRMPQVYHEHDTVKIAEAKFEYGPGDRVIRAVVQQRTTTDEMEWRSSSTHDYIYDDAGQKIVKETHAVWDDGNSTRRKEYTYDGEGRMASISTRSRGMRSTRWSSFTTFEYDSRGNRIAVHQRNQTSAPRRYEYDANDRLVSLGLGRVFVWDEGGRLLRNGVHRIDYTYEAGGRLYSARFAGGGGYTVSYDASCPTDFGDPAFTPNVDGHLYYEGRNPTLRLW